MPLARRQECLRYYRIMRPLSWLFASESSSAGRDRCGHSAGKSMHPFGDRRPVREPSLQSNDSGDTSLACYRRIDLRQSFARTDPLYKICCSFLQFDCREVDVCKSTTMPRFSWTRDHAIG